METEKISIPKTHLSFLIPSYQKKLSELKTELNRLVEEISSIDHVLKSINEINLDSENEVQKTTKETLSDSKIDSLAEGYDKNWSWIRKITFCLENNKKPLGTGEILKFLLNKENDLKGKGRNISAVISLNVSKTNPSLYRVEQDDGKILYGLKKWQTEDKPDESESIGIFAALTNDIFENNN